jgi:hypothetical protein
MYSAIFLTASTVTPYKHQFFHPDDRLLQTIETYESIKKHIPNSFCILIEGSKLTDEQREILTNCYDVVLECGEDSQILSFVQSLNIGIGEMKLLQQGIQYIQKHKLESEYIFKLGARYTLSDKFNLNNYQIDKYTFRPEICMEMLVYNTGLYNIPTEKLKVFYDILTRGITLLQGDYPIERVYCELINKGDVLLREVIGLEGRISYNGNFFSK